MGNGVETGLLGEVDQSHIETWHTLAKSAIQRGATCYQHYHQTASYSLCSDHPQDRRPLNFTQLARMLELTRCLGRATQSVLIQPVTRSMTALILGGERERVVVAPNFEGFTVGVGDITWDSRLDRTCITYNRNRALHEWYTKSSRDRTDH